MYGVLRTLFMYTGEDLSVLSVLSVGGELTSDFLLHPSLVIFCPSQYRQAIEPYLSDGRSVSVPSLLLPF